MFTFILDITPASSGSHESDRSRTIIEADIDEESKLDPQIPDKDFPGILIPH